ncbi:cobyrinate a,c-diamide synthase [Pelomicrobium sp. G1]|uniref:cobyrinate a,c-diamide synthase n=1 Tax=unclassified Pelomicrobium TaxID=2815318 RepID=UPI003F76691E
MPQGALESSPQTAALRHCPALLVTAPASGQGKTTATAALARLHCRQGRRVRVFKTGPDFLDPMILERASGAPVYPLDLWMVGEAECRRRLFEAAGEADLILVEGVMGLYDGEPSSADLAIALGLPVLLVVDAFAMAQTFGAVCYGLAAYRPGLRVAGVVANRVGGPRHGELLKASLPPGLTFFGAVTNRADLALPDRHLGLFQAQEIGDLDARLDAAAQAVAATGAAELPAPVAFAKPADSDVERLLEGVRIGVARDAGFSFLYPANLDLLRRLGAELIFFSPLEDDNLPPVDSVWLPGGYPELHLDRLAGNEGMRRALRAHHERGKPILAECGGMLYLLEALTHEGHRAPMAGLVPGEAVMQERLAALGLQEVQTPEGPVRGHTFHHSRLTTGLEPWARAVTPRGDPGEAVYRIGRLTASYVHFYFPSNPRAVAAFFKP